jgi:AGCS family alanine or glycine:cation symporter
MTALAMLSGMLSSFIWGAPMLALLIGTGLWMSFSTGFVQLRRFGYAMRHTIGRVFREPPAGRGSVTPFQTVTTALAATLGTGNIAGVSFALMLGGAGALFWMWVSALLGMATKYAEVVLAVAYRRRNGRGDWVGGPMHYISRGLGDSWRPLAVLFALAGALAALASGNAVQTGAIAAAANTAVRLFFPDTGVGKTAVSCTVGLLIALTAALTYLGGLRRLGKVTERLVPFMGGLYIAACLAVILTQLPRLGGVFAQILQGAFSPAAAAGGAGGFTLRQAMVWGFRRGLFSHEAGLGSSPMAHAAPSETDPVRQGFYGIFEVFVDTFVICGLTGLTLLVSGVDLRAAGGGPAANAAAFGILFGDRAGSLLVALCLALFSLSTVLSWGHYGALCCEFLFGPLAAGPYRGLFVLTAAVGPVLDLGLSLQLADTLNGLMAIPNLIALLALSGVVRNLTRRHFRYAKDGEIKVYF